MYECEKENQESLDSLNIISNCCGVNILATTDDTWLCSSCSDTIENTSTDSEDKK